MDTHKFCVDVVQWDGCPACFDNGTAIRNCKATVGNLLCGHDEVDAVLIGLLSVGAEPKPLHCALTGLLALGSEIGGHGYAELSVVQGQLSEVLVGVRGE